MNGSKAGRGGLVRCGGNIEPRVLVDIIPCGMVGLGWLARQRGVVRDVPAALGDVAERQGCQGANIDDMQHQRAFTILSVERAQIAVVVPTLGNEHVNDFLSAVRSPGYSAEHPR